MCLSGLSRETKLTRSKLFIQGETQSCLGWPKGITIYVKTKEKEERGNGFKMAHKEIV